MALRSLSGRIARVGWRHYSQRNVLPVIQCADTSQTKPSERLLALNQQVKTQREQVLGSTSTKEGSSKKTARERLSLLADEGSEVLEIGLLAGLGLAYGDVPGAGCVVCIVEVCGEKCVVSANDWTVKGGSSYPITVKKQLRAQEIAMQNRLPCIYMVDSGGAFLPLQSEIYPDKEHGGRVFRNEAIMSSLGIPQIAMVTGLCTAGGAYVPSMCDEAIMVDKISSLFLGGPPLVRAATGEVLTAEELGGATVHCSISGVTDHFAKTEEDAVAMTRSIVSCLNLSQPSCQSYTTCVEEPRLPASDEDFAVALETEQEQMLQIISRLVDGSRLQQFKEKFGPTLCTGFARINGKLVGILGNQGVLDEAAALKGAHFVRVCDIRDIPLVFLVNTQSDADFLAPHGTPGLVAKARAQMMSVVATAKVPKLTVVIGNAYGPSSIAMAGRCMEPNFMFCWPNAQIAIASSSDIQTAIGGHTHLHDLDTPLKDQSFLDEVLYPSSSLYHDGIILPSETRQILSRCLAICSQYRQRGNSKSSPVLRM